MERTQRVAKLEALLARVQSRSGRAEAGGNDRAATHGNAAVAMQGPAAAVPIARIAPVAAPVVHAAPQVAATPKPSPVAASAPPPAAHAAALTATHETQEEAATVVRDVPVEALAAIAAATAAATAQGQSNLMPPAAAQPAAGNPAPAAAQAPAPTPAPAFRGTSAFGGLSKKMTLIGTAPPANWPPRGAESSVPPPDPAAAAAAATPAAIEEAPQDTHEAAPEIQATESDGDLDALLGDEASLPPTEERPAAAPAAAPLAVTASPAIAEPKKAELPIVSPDAPLAKKKSGSALTYFAMIVLWLIALGVIWFVYRSSM